MHVEYLGCNSLQGLQQHSYVLMLTIFTSLCILVRLFTLIPFLLFIYLNFVCHRLKNKFINIVPQRGAAIIKAWKASSALSAASAACDHMRDWVLGTPKVDSLSSQIAFDHAKLICFYILLFFKKNILLSFVNFPLAL